jgi:hypothetical protein
MRFRQVFIEGSDCIFAKRRKQDAASRSSCWVGLPLANADTAATATTQNEMKAFIDASVKGRDTATHEGVSSVAIRQMAGKT